MRYSIINIICALTICASLFVPVQNSDAQEGQPDAMPVITSPVEQVTTRLWNTFSARLTAVDAADIRPQVSGTITDIRFNDGDNVSKGDILFVIDPRPYSAAQQQAKAQLRAAQTRANLAQTELDRARHLIRSNAISQRLYDERANTVQVTMADVQNAKAQVRQANINLDYAYVKAPISGRTGRVEVTKGNLVNAGANAPLLTSIVSDNGIYADFEVDEQTYLSQMRALHGADEGKHTIPVTLELDPSLPRIKGVIHSFDNRIDPTSGTMRARAKFENKDGMLLPGMFSRIRIGSADMQTVLMVPERAVGVDQDRRFVYVVDNGQAVRRVITIGSVIEGKRIVTSGLKKGDVVISEGIIRIRPGMSVTAKLPQEGQ